MPLVHAVEVGKFDMVTTPGSFDKTTEGSTTIFRSKSALSVDWAPADDSLGSEGRTEGWWFGVKVTSPETFTKEQYEKIQYGWDGKTWKSFKANHDKYIGDTDKMNQGENTLWVKTTQEEYDAAKKTDSHLITKYIYLDWDGDNKADETVRVILVTDNVTLDGTEDFVTLTVKNNVDDTKVVIRLTSGAKLEQSQLDSIKSKAGYTFKYAYQTVDEEQKEIENLKNFTIEKDTVISAYFEKNGSATTTPSGNQGSSTTKPADKDKDSTPKTGNTDLMGFVPLMTLLSLVGIVTLKKTI